MPEAADVDRLAAELRSRAGLLGSRPPHSTRRLLAAVAPDVLVTGSRSLPRGVLELVTASPGEAPTVYYARRAPTVMQRWGIAHALGHIALHLPAEGLHRPIVITGCQRQEREADALAAELLCPLDELAAEVSGRDLFPRGAAARHAWDDLCDGWASTWQIPPAVLRSRLRALAQRDRR